MKGFALVTCSMLVFMLFAMSTTDAVFRRGGSSPNIFQYKCESTCAQTWCSFGLGCTRCKAGYCRYFTGRRNAPNVCLRNCPRGYRCQGSPIIGPFCTRARG